MASTSVTSLCVRPAVLCFVLVHSEIRKILFLSVIL